MRPPAFLLVLLALFSFAARASVDDFSRNTSSARGISLCEALTRSTTILSEEDLLPPTTDPLINALVLAHVQTYRRNDPRRNAANWRKFDGSWVLMPEYRDLLEEIVLRFGREKHIIDGGEATFKAFLARWEKVYKDAGIDFAASWQSRDVQVTGRKRFMRAIILRVALKEQNDIGFVHGPLLWSTKPEAKSFVDRFHDEIIAAFGNLKAMQDAYDVYYRARNGRYVSRPRIPESALLAETAGQLRQYLGSRRIRTLWTPWVDAFKRERARISAVEDWMEAIRYWQEEYLPLVPLVQQETTGVESWSNARAVMGKWKSIRDFIRALNHQLDRRALPKVGIGVGIGKDGGNFTELHWRQELLVQVCLLQIRLCGGAIPYTGFSVSDIASDNPYQILSTSELWTEAKLSISRLNEIVMMRLTEPPREDYGDEP